MAYTEQFRIASLPLDGHPQRLVRKKALDIDDSHCPQICIGKLYIIIDTHACDVSIDGHKGSLVGYEETMIHSEHWTLMMILLSISFDIIFYIQIVIARTQTSDASHYGRF